MKPELERSLVERRIRRLAERKGLTLVDLAKAANIGRETIYRMFKSRSPRYDTLSKMARALDTTPGTLLEGAIRDDLRDKMQHLIVVCSDLNDEALFRVLNYATYERDHR